MLSKDDLLEATKFLRLQFNPSRAEEKVFVFQEFFGDLPFQVMADACRMAARYCTSWPSVAELAPFIESAKKSHPLTRDGNTEEHVYQNLTDLEICERMGADPKHFAQGMAFCAANLGKPYTEHPMYLRSKALLVDLLGSQGAEIATSLCPAGSPEPEPDSSVGQGPHVPDPSIEGLPDPSKEVLPSPEG